MFPSFHPLLLPGTGNFTLHKSILWELHLKSHHLPTLTGLYSTLNGIKYFIVTCTVIDTELWLCLDKNLIQCFMPDCLFNILQINSAFSDLLQCVPLCMCHEHNKVLPGMNLMRRYSKTKNQVAALNKSYFYVHVKLKMAICWDNKTKSLQPS